MGESRERSVSECRKQKWKRKREREICIHTYSMTNNLGGNARAVEMWPNKVADTPAFGGHILYNIHLVCTNSRSISSATLCRIFIIYGFHSDFKFHSFIPISICPISCLILDIKSYRISFSILVSSNSVRAQAAECDAEIALQM